MRTIHATRDLPLTRRRQLQALFDRFGLVEEMPLLLVEDGNAVRLTQPAQPVSTFHLIEMSAKPFVHLDVILEGDDAAKSSDVIRELRTCGFVATVAAE